MILRLAFDVLFGTLLGVFFYGGLWLTVRRFPTTHHPLALTLGSLLLRMAVTLAGFFLIVDGRWQNAVAALAGFTVARLYLVNRRTPCT
ncbi:MAG: ATP synthase subunit I [Bryobacteraceae bacterium]|jgi:F1F0 ATPase subunit 2